MQTESQASFIVNGSQCVVSEIVEVLFVLTPDSIAAELLSILVAAQHYLVKLAVERLMTLRISIIQFLQFLIFGIMSGVVF